MKWPKHWEAIAVAIVYTMAHALMLLDRGLFFDDWLAYRLPTPLLIQLAHESGSIWPDLAAWLPYSSAIAIWVTRVVVFFCFLAVALLAHHLLRRLPHFDAEARVAVASLIAVYPVMAARDVTVDWPYAVSLALFMCGWVLLDRSVGTRRWVSRVAALALFAVSFRTGSLGLFYAVIPVWVLWRSGVSWRKPRDVVSGLIKWADVVILPVAFIVYRSISAQPYGPYADYNKLDLYGLATGLLKIPAALWHSLVDAFLRMPSVVWLPVAALAAAVAGLALWKSVSEAGEAIPLKRSFEIWRATAIWGLALVVIGVYPYLAVHKMPRFLDFDTRHQLLVPFGAALLIYGVARAALGGEGRRRVVRLAVLAVLIGLCAGTAAGDHLSYQREWFKELGMVEVLRQAPQAQTGKTFIFDDRAIDLNANGRSRRRFYEYAGAFKMAFNTETRFGADRRDFTHYGMNHYVPMLNATFKLADYYPTPIDFYVTLKRGSENLHDPGVLTRLLWEEWTKSPKFGADVAKTVRLTFVPAR